MSEKQDKEIYLPESTRELLPFLETMYPAKDVARALMAGNTADAQKQAGKIELIDELIELYGEQNAEFAARRATQR